ncbi:hypothetical protein L2E82_31060 [Cichorium intybus]|uniref:Uncharacterized protein n=1 Tax=Cichorium intybus TaxID=13427 RepID=A0ACB9D2S0_CICIN|nr:hypothetical protein L2E82_31060 [Cichorium intybus]
MASLLGFHPPHFSEDAAWLPGWLQPSTIREASNQALQCPSAQGLEEIGCLQQNISNRDNENLSDNGVCKSFHLFLSGEDNSTMNFPSCSSNHEIQYHLHLSTNEESQNLSNSISSKSQFERFEPKQAQILHHPNSKVTPEENTRNPTPQKGNSGTSSHEPKGQNRKNHKSNPKSRKVDIFNAIELAVAASEALIIHELVKDEPSTQLSSLSSVLEAAIRVKQARLEENQENLDFEESDEVDFLSDLDELTMVDAYEDVGLMGLTSHGDLSGYESVSHVKDSYGGQENDFNSNSSKEDMLLKRGFVLDSIDYEELGTQNADLGCDVDHTMFNCSVEQADNCMKEVDLQRERELTSCQRNLRSSFGSQGSGFNEKEDKTTNLIPDRFQSRWFGGWTAKNEVTDDNHKTSIPNLFPNETSFLSESPPDMNSAIQKPDNIFSQSSVADKITSNGNLLPENLDISQSNSPPKDTVFQSPIDLSCSVVPCTYTSDTHTSLGPTLQPNSDTTKPVSPQISNNEKKTNLPLTIDSQENPLQENFDTAKTVLPQILNNEKKTNLPLTIDSQENPIQENFDTTKTVLPQILNNKKKTNLPLTIDSQENPVQEPNFDTTKTVSPQLSNNEKKTNLPLTIDSQENPVPERKLPIEVFKKVKSNIKSCLVPRRKRVRFSEPEIFYPTVKKRKTRLTYNTRLFQDLTFLITGFSVKKHKEIKNLIQENGGIVLEDIPPLSSRRKRSQTCPIVLCPKRLLTTKFLYACAVNACIVKVNWLYDSVNDGSILPPKKYTILKENPVTCGVSIGMAVNRDYLIFENIAIMFHGKHDFCMKMGKVVRHGGGLVFKTFHWLVKRLESRKDLVGAIVVEGENVISRQLKQCAVERNVRVVSFDWIIRSLYAGRVLPSPEFSYQNRVHLEMSEEI